MSTYHVFSFPPFRGCAFYLALFACPPGGPAPFAAIPFLLSFSVGLDSLKGSQETADPPVRSRFSLIPPPYVAWVPMHLGGFSGDALPHIYLFLPPFLRFFFFFFFWITPSPPEMLGHPVFEYFVFIADFFSPCTAVLSPFVKHLSFFRSLRLPRTVNFRRCSAKVAFSPFVFT